MHAQQSSGYKCLRLSLSLYLHNLCVLEAMALVILRFCAGSSLPSAVAFAISTRITCCDFFNLVIVSAIWASTRENLSSVVCEQHRRRPACASAQSDQRLCYSLFIKYYMYTCCRWNFNFLASLCSWGDWFETRFGGHPENRFSRDEAHIIAT